MDHNGNGIGKLDNKVIFIPKTITGDICDIEIYKEYKNYDIGRLNNIIEKSNDRVDNICPYYNICGGCNISNLDYNKQLDYYEEVLSSTSFYTSKPELVKKLNGVAKSWCTRTTDGDSDGPYENSYICFTETGAGTSIGVNGEVGISPAFRIGSN